MIKRKVLVLFFIISIIYGVMCDDAEEVKRRGLSRARQKYRYNHPPEPENYGNIPVALVYDKVIDRTHRGRKVKPAKEIDHVTSIPIAKSTPEVTISPEIKSEDKITTEYPVNNAVIPNTNTKKPEPKEIKLAYKIPVSVVYDEDPGIVRRNRIKSGVSTRLRKPIQKQENPNGESLKQSEATLSKGEDGLKPVSRITEKDSFENISQEQKPIMEVIGSKQENIKSVTTQNSSPKVISEIETEKKRIHGEPEAVVPIIASENRVFGHNGEFKYSYEGGDGTKAFSKGQLRTFDEEVAGEAVEGGFSYKDKDGNDFSLSYTADENGYRPVGAHLPTPPPIPPAIARALAYLATKTTPETVTEPLDVEENTPTPN